MPWHRAQGRALSVALCFLAYSPAAPALAFSGSLSRSALCPRSLPYTLLSYLSQPNPSKPAELQPTAQNCNSTAAGLTRHPCLSVRNQRELHWLDRLPALVSCYAELHPAWLSDGRQITGHEQSVIDRTAESQITAVWLLSMCPTHFQPGIMSLCVSHVSRMNLDSINVHADVPVFIRKPDPVFKLGCQPWPMMPQGSLYKLVGKPKV